jgi:hypothetical protein
LYHSAQTANNYTSEKLRFEVFMESIQNGGAPVNSRAWVWTLFLIGGVLFVVGPVLYAVQFNMKHLTTPWYLPILATIGVGLMALSVWQRRGLVRTVGLLLCVVVCGFEWYIFGEAARTPVYAGPVKVGGKLPAFDTNLASGATFTNADLEKGEATLLVFFRGRW